jgi:hypothetical protein
MKDENTQDTYLPLFLPANQLYIFIFLIKHLRHPFKRRLLIFLSRKRESFHMYGVPGSAIATIYQMTTALRKEHFSPEYCHYLRQKKLNRP